MKKNISRFEDLEVYQKLCALHLDIHELTINFPEFEMHEIGSELRQSSNSAPAFIAEGCSNKHTRLYLEKIARASGEVRQTKHYLNISLKKSYIELQKHKELIYQYDECERMLKTLEKSIKSWKMRTNTFTKYQFPDSYHP